MKILIISPKNKTVFNFRGDLIKDMIASGNDVLVTGPNQDFVDDIYSLGVSKFIEVPLVKDNTSVLGDLAYLKALKRIMKEERPDLVFSYTIKPVIYGSIAAKASGVKNIYAMVTGLGRVYGSSGFKTKIIRTITKHLYRKAFKSCNAVIFQNSDDLNTFVNDKYLPKEKAKLVNGSGVNMERFKKTPLPEKVSFLMIGRIIKEKGVFEYCEAAKIVKEKYPETKFVLLGGFDNSIGAIKPEDIQPYIDSGVIEFPGETKDPVSYYQNASVFVLPSYYREGLPRTILEAMSCGRAVITTDWPGCREPIVEGQNGFLIEIKNVSSIVAKELFFIENQNKLQTMSQKAFDICKEYYDVLKVNLSMKAIMNY